MAATFSLTSTLRVTPRWVDALDVIEVVDTVSPSLTFTLTNGTGAGQANGYWKGVVSITANQTTSIDLRALPLSVFGGTGTLSLASVKALLVVNKSATAAVTLGGSVTDRWAGRSADSETIGPSGVLYAVNGTGWATSASSKVLTFTAAANATCDLYLAGVKS
jgi:hypothetical protein